MIAPAIAPEVQPGQFVHLQIPHLQDSILRRPFSVYQADQDRLTLLYKDIGKGTHAMTQLVPDDRVSLIGPLGRPFPQHQEGAHPVLVAGGYGMAALYLVARNQPTTGTAFFGGATDADILCVDEFEALGWEVRVTTVDGSLGTQGLVTAQLDEWFAGAGADTTPEFFACGPNAMLQAVNDRARPRGWTAWLSMDRNMCCGVGACLTCVQKVVADDGADWAWARVCTEGPVFECREIVWE
jgi:dihydroorotate dehydrogenase electron transfer subunit